MNPLILRWLGSQLGQARIKSKKTMRMIARETEVPLQKIKDIENGIFHINLGLLHDIIRKSYDINFFNLLNTCYETHREYFDPEKSRSFKRDRYYSVCLEAVEDRGPTPLLIGGDPKRYIWAVPMRWLKEQPLMIELLELAPARTHNPSGATPKNSHSGVEIIHVIYGKIYASFTYSGETIDRPLGKGNCIHLQSRHVHNIRNADKNSPALLLIIRLE